MQNPILIGDSPVQPHASIGIPLSGPGQLTADELLRRADAAMYQAKATTRQNGTTGVATYAAEPAEAAGPGAAPPPERAEVVVLGKEP